MKKLGVIFDLDGTVVENSFDWRRIREEIGAGETTQGAEGLLSIRVAEHDSGHERDFDEGDGF